ncbi:M23 family metallopeptidase [Glycomyces sp. L485]|uniref:M23 family metallopeptidase n=1 Tax=Glycomyces sp. L485 TaxID=2909235 RepID=UPI001F4B6414|nr:M23 family metallopeptidase [Glycomyces sp. L485]MCH7229362.1 M23 family metallopeptidase [Glycomyces sp. L485]
MTTLESPRRPRWWRRWMWGVALVSVCCLGAAGVVIQLLADQSDDDNGGNQMMLAGCGNNVMVDPDADLPSVGVWSEDQVYNAAIIVSVGQELEIPARGWIVAVATAMQESRLTNLGHLGDRNDHDSLGLFQQRPSSGWGTPEQIQDPVYAATKFYEKLKTIDGWEGMALTEAAQRVQISAYPFAYAKHEPDATDIVNTLTGGGGRSSAVNVSLGECAGPGELSAAGWIIPVQGPIWSGFRTAARPTHQGVDIGAPRDTPVVAASSGTVITSECNAFGPDGSPYSCDVDGSPSVAGCGWYINILHAGDYLTRYCHFSSRPLVKEGDVVRAGQILGYVGSSGRSSGPHLHYEVHLNGDRSSEGAVDPVAFMSNVGAPLE